MDIASWVLVISLAIVALETGWLFYHYVFPGQPLRSQLDIYFLVFLKAPIFSITAFAMLLGRRAKAQLSRRAYRTAWLIWSLTMIVGLPLWFASLVV